MVNGLTYLLPLLTNEVVLVGAALIHMVMTGVDSTQLMDYPGLKDASGQKVIHLAENLARMTLKETASKENQPQKCYTKILINW